MSEKVYKLSSEQLSTEMNQEIMILNPIKGEYYKLDAVGYTVWKSLEQGPKTLPELVGIVTDTYEVSPENCLADLKSLLIDLENEKLLSSY
jgi:hypothetical protein